MAVFNGSAATLAYNTNGGTTWTTVPNVVSIDANFDVEEIDTTHNSSSYYKQFLPGDMSGTFNFTLRYDPADATHAALIGTIFNNRSLITGAPSYYFRVSPNGTAVDGDNATGISYRAIGIITNFSNSMQHSQGVDITFTVRLTSTITLDAAA